MISHPYWILMVRWVQYVRFFAFFYLISSNTMYHAVFFLVYVLWILFDLMLSSSTTDIFVIEFHQGMLLRLIKIGRFHLVNEKSKSHAASKGNSLKKNTKKSTWQKKKENVRRVVLHWRAPRHFSLIYYMELASFRASQSFVKYCCPPKLFTPKKNCFNFLCMHYSHYFRKQRHSLTLCIVSLTFIISDVLIHSLSTA